MQIIPQNKVMCGDADYYLSSTIALVFYEIAFYVPNTNDGRQFAALNIAYADIKWKTFSVITLQRAVDAEFPSGTLLASANGK
jgi:hypothetical protein